jgi:bacillithiol system protein YtxJ
MSHLGRLVNCLRMHPRLTAVQRIEELDSLLTLSGTRPLLLFKHSYSCGISAEALDELLGHLDAAADAQKQPDTPLYAMVTVQTHRDVSNAVAARLGVRHETPQALLVRDGQVIWTASHFRVTADAVAAAIKAAAQ